MSVEAITWALKQPVTHSSAKFVLVVLSNCASADTFIAYPSVAYLATATGQDRKTVMANIGRLIEWGLIEDTGKRTGQTRQIIVYRVRCGPDLFTEESQKRDSTESGTVPKKPNNSTVIPRKQSQKRDTETSGNKRNRQSLAQQVARFEEFWAAYPKRVGRKPSETKWKAKRLDALADTIIADVANRIANDGRWLDGFIPDPRTYLTQERWADEIQPRREHPGAAPTHVSPTRLASTPSPRKPEMNPLERAIDWAHHQYHYHWITIEERDRLIAEANEKHQEKAEA